MGERGKMGKRKRVSMTAKEMEGWKEKAREGGREAEREERVQPSDCFIP